MGYVNDLSAADFKSLLAGMVESNDRHHRPTASAIHLSKYLQLLDGKLTLEDFKAKANLYSIVDLRRLKKDGLFIDVYLRMVKELKKVVDDR